MPTLENKHKRVAPIGWKSSQRRNWLSPVTCGRAYVNASARFERITHRTRKMARVQNVVSINDYYSNQFSKRLYCKVHLGIIRSPDPRCKNQQRPVKDVVLAHQRFFTPMASAATCYSPCRWSLPLWRPKSAKCFRVQAFHRQPGSGRHGTMGPTVLWRRFGWWPKSHLGNWWIYRRNSTV